MTRPQPKRGNMLAGWRLPPIRYAHLAMDGSFLIRKKGNMGKISKYLSRRTKEVMERRAKLSY